MNVFINYLDHTIITNIISDIISEIKTKVFEQNLAFFETIINVQLIINEIISSENESSEYFLELFKCGG